MIGPKSGKVVVQVNKQPPRRMEPEQFGARP